MEQLKCGVQQYAWGKAGATSAVAHLAVSGAHTNDFNRDEKYAELWIGTHPSKPSEVVSKQQPLSDFLVGPDAQIPYLLKVLSIDKALSIQSHPHKELAEKLHKEDPTHYPDSNHKPELVVALTPFEALCCFRPNEAIAAFLESIPPLRAMVSNSADVITHGSSNNSEQKATLRSALTSLYEQPANVLQQRQDEHLNALKSQSTLTEEDKVFIRLTKDFPGDVGIWMVYFLNYVQLVPGDGLFLAPNEPHAYLSGDAVEIMASSDNVIRAGLTPKFKDVTRLLESLTYSTSSLREAFFPSQWSTDKLQVYAPPGWCTDFSLVAIRVVDDEAVHMATHSTALLLAVEGAGRVCSKEVRAGEVFVIPKGTEVSVEKAGKSPLLLFIAQKNGALSNL